MYALFHTGQTYPYGKQGIQGRKEEIIHIQKGST